MAAALFLSFDGRIGRRQWWIGTIIVEGSAAVLAWLAGVPLLTYPESFDVRLSEFVIQLFTIYPNLAISVKRLHDRDRSAITVLPLIAASAAMLIGNLFGYFDTSSSMT